MFNEDPNPPRLIGNVPLLPLRTKTRGPAYTLPFPNPPLPPHESPDPDAESYDILDEVLSLFRANTFFRNFEIQARGETFRLTVLEAMLLKLLVQNQGRVVGKAEILEKVWNLSPDTETRAVDNFIVRLRRYLEDNPRFPKHLLTVRGAGYKLTV